MDTLVDGVVYATQVNVVPAVASIQQEMQQEIAELKRLNYELSVENIYNRNRSDELKLLNDKLFVAINDSNEKLEELCELPDELKLLNDKLFVAINDSNEKLEELCELRDMVKSLSKSNVTFARRMAAMVKAEHARTAVEEDVAHLGHVPGWEVGQVVSIETEEGVEEKAVKKAAKWKERMERKIKSSMDATR